MSENYKIQVQGLKKQFGNKVVLDGLDIDLKKGESLVIIGGSGSGKSVSIKCIIGLIHPDSGSIKIDGVETTNLKGTAREELMHKFGMLFQGGALFDSLTVAENITFGLKAFQTLNKDQAQKIALEKLQEVGLAPEVGNLSPAELSGGMQKRVALARAIAANPEIIFFDEPTTGLDPIMCSVIDNLILKCVRKLGASAITITHDLKSARRIADKVAMIFQGKIIWSGSVKELDTCKNPYVRQFVEGSTEGPITPETPR